MRSDTGGFEPGKDIWFCSAITWWDTSPFYLTRKFLINFYSWYCESTLRTRTHVCQQDSKLADSCHIYRPNIATRWAVHRMSCHLVLLLEGRWCYDLLLNRIWKLRMLMNLFFQCKVSHFKGTSLLSLAYYVSFDLLITQFWKPLQFLCSIELKSFSYTANRCSFKSKCQYKLLNNVLNIISCFVHWHFYCRKGLNQLCVWRSGIHWLCS